MSDLIKVSKNQRNFILETINLLGNSDNNKSGNKNSECLEHKENNTHTNCSHHKCSDGNIKNKSNQISNENDYENLNGNKVGIDLKYEVDKNRIIGGTDYKKFEEISKSLEIENKNESKNNNELEKNKLKMGCNNDKSKERQLYEKTTNEKLDAAKLFKSEGDYLLKNKEYQKAIDFYEKSLLQLFYTFEDTDEESAIIDNLKYGLNMNISICKINQNNFKDVIGYLQEAEKTNEGKSNSKCFYRLAFTYYNLEDYAKAEEYIKKGLCFCKDSEQVNAFVNLTKEMENKKILNENKSNEFLKKCITTVNSK